MHKKKTHTHKHTRHTRVWLQEDKKWTNMYTLDTHMFDNIQFWRVCTSFFRLITKNSLYNIRAGIDHTQSMHLWDTVWLGTSSVSGRNITFPRWCIRPFDQSLAHSFLRPWCWRDSTCPKGCAPWVVARPWLKCDGYARLPRVYIKNYAIQGFHWMKMVVGFRCSELCFLTLSLTAEISAAIGSRADIFSVDIRDSCIFPVSLSLWAHHYFLVSKSRNSINLDCWNDFNFF